MSNVESILAGARSFLVVDWLPADAAAGARALVEAAGLAYVDQPYLAGAVRAVG